MKTQLLILIFALIGVMTSKSTQAQTYDPLAVQRINDLIANNGLQATPNAPETWDFATWNNESPKQIVELVLSPQYIPNLCMKGDASFAGLTTLQMLNLAFNQLSKIDLTNCLQIQTFKCVGNIFLKELDITGCTQLQNLYCTGNQLTTLNLTNCKHLYHLSCERNRLFECNLMGLDKLTEFYGSSQGSYLTLNQNEAEEYTLNIFLNNPTFTNSAISYSEGILKSTDKNVSWTEFSVQTNKTGFELSGRIDFTYSNLGVDYPDRDQLKVYPNPVMEKLIIGNGQLTIKNIDIYDINGKKQKAES